MYQVSQSLAIQADTSQLDFFAPVIGIVSTDGLSKVSVDKACKPAGSTHFRLIVLDHQMELDFTKPILQGRPAVEIRIPQMTSQTTRSTVEFLRSGLSYECGLVKKHAMVFLFLHMQITIWYIIWT